MSGRDPGQFLDPCPSPLKADATEQKPTTGEISGIRTSKTLSSRPSIVEFPQSYCGCTGSRYRYFSQLARICHPARTYPPVSSDTARDRYTNRILQPFVPSYRHLNTIMLSFMRPAQPPRTNNTANNPIIYDAGRSSVTFAKPNSDYVMTHRIPPTTKEHGTSIVTPPFHYHIFQDEFFNVQSGIGRFYRGVDKEPFAILSDRPDGQRTASVKAGRYHRFENASETEDLVVDIHLTPESYEDEQRFFRNFFGYLDDCRGAGKPPSFFQLMVFLHSADTPFAVPLPWEWLGKVASRLLLWGAAYWGRFALGYKTTYPEYYEEGKSR